MAYTFGTEEILAALGITNPAFYAVQDDSYTENYDNAVVLSHTGNFLSASSKTFNRTDNRTITLKVIEVPPNDIMFGPCTLGGKGAGDSGIVLTKITVAMTNTDWPTITVEAHAHGTDPGDENHLDEGGVEIDAQPCYFGIADAFGSDYLSKDFNTSPALSSLQSFSYTYELTHIDKQNSEGEQLIGHSYGLVRRCEAEFISDGTAITMAANRNISNITTRKVNTDFHVSTVSYETYEELVL